MKQSEINYLGMGKTKFNSSVCLISDGEKKIQIWLTERLNRKKSSGEWPSLALKETLYSVGNNNFLIAENRDVHDPSFFEDFYDEKFPFYDFLIKSKLEHFTKKYNPSISTESHHEAHAYAALAMSPFQKSIMIVMDGAGNAIDGQKDLFENCSVYLQNEGVVRLVYKSGCKIFKSKNVKGQTFSDGMGLFYEKMSDFIFNNSTSSGKVMGLAPFGKALQVDDRVEFQEMLDWNNSFKGKTKKSWETSENFNLYCSIAATAQNELEKYVEDLLISLKIKFPEYDNLIITGGCALNCTNNAKIKNKKLFNKIYVLPFPGDESIGFGLASLLRLKSNPNKWKVSAIEFQNPYMGPVSSVLSDEEIEKKLIKNGINFKYNPNIVDEAVNDLVNGKIIGWFQGRSESGPRALGNRSILARPDKPDLKNYLNQNIKFRESFRPYGCSVLHEYVDEYFQVEKGFDNPYMSFAVKVNKDYEDVLMQVSHIDNTSRMQTVRESQNEKFYNLIKKFGIKTNLYCLLNTSLNVMGEPIVETVDDAISFFKNTPVDYQYIGNFKLTRK